MHLYGFTQMIYYRPERIKIVANQVGFKGVSGNFNYRSITFFSVADRQCQVLILFWHELKLAVVIIINEIFFARFRNFGIEYIFAVFIFLQIPVGGDVFLDFSILGFLRAGNNLIKINLFDRQVKSFFFLLIMQLSTRYSLPMYQWHQVITFSLSLRRVFGA